jgi:hypothetical protein
VAKGESTLLIKIKDVGSKALKEIKRGLDAIAQATQKATNKVNPFKSQGKKAFEETGKAAKKTAPEIQAVEKAIEESRKETKRLAKGIDDVNVASDNLANETLQDFAKMDEEIEKTNRGSVQRLKEGFKKAAIAAAAIGAAIVAFVAKSVQAFRVQELAVNRLNNAMINAGDFTLEASKDMQKFASSLQDVSTFGDEVIIGQLAIAKTFGTTNEEAKKLVTAATRLSAATGMTLDSAVLNLGKSLGGLAGELGERVTDIRTLTAEELKAGAAIDLVINKYEGANEAMAAGLGGVDQLKNAFGDLMEKVGEKFAPAIGFVTLKLKEFLKEADGGITIIDGFASIFKFATGMAFSLVKAFDALGASIGIGLASAVRAAELAWDGQFKKAKEVMAQGMKEIGEVQKKAEEENQAALAELNDIEVDQTKKKNELIEKQEKQSEENKKQMKLQTQRETFEASQIQAEEQEVERLENDLALMDASELQKLQRAQQLIDKQLQQKQTFEDKKTLLEAKAINLRMQKEAKSNAAAKKLQDKEDDEKLKNKKETNQRLLAMQGSSNKSIAAVAKGAALTNIAIDTPGAVMKAMNSGIPYPFNLIAAASVAAFGAEQAAKVAGVQLAEGGIVRATPGGVQATIAEGGKDEVVIPLDDDEATEKLAGGSTFVFNGPILGDESQAEQFAVAIDRKLLELRQSGQSVAFDEDIQ